ncbi:MAG TPA: hypothetical protein VFX97_13945 [Pyrinomonadaceae bacterium]|nr:hypothetical protein [Pyrinomonadaceae bacterium]
MGDPQLSLQSGRGTSMLRAESAVTAWLLAESLEVSGFVMAVCISRGTKDVVFFPGMVTYLHGSTTSAVMQGNRYLRLFKVFYFDL